jgi:hypothetical protein
LCLELRIDPNAWTTESIVEPNLLSAGVWKGLSIFERNREALDCCPPSLPIWPRFGSSCPSLIVCGMLLCTANTPLFSKRCWVRANSCLLRGTARARCVLRERMAKVIASVASLFWPLLVPETLGLPFLVLVSPHSDIAPLFVLAPSPPTPP